ncbi:hypothetical protein Vspart_04037 [Vibrio spartinae]|uniref:Uncharacterized protein n=1 Tax=Vibrio spartinae TaxID=1918945 RepID=A0A1N6MAH6_9VIBR|nr:hypothetical protein Vspart_04037 [Vibrio spartinae]SIO96465.1 hypothetical protein VSP9026_04254 [Vibrio spartinae]
MVHPYLHQNGYYFYVARFALKKQNVRINKASVAWCATPL